MEAFRLELGAGRLPVAERWQQSSVGNMMSAALSRWVPGVVVSG